MSVRMHYKSTYSRGRARGIGISAWHQPSIRFVHASSDGFGVRQHSLISIHSLCPWEKNPSRFIPPSIRHLLYIRDMDGANGQHGLFHLWGARRCAKSVFCSSDFTFSFPWDGTARIRGGAPSYRAFSQCVRACLGEKGAGGLPLGPDTKRRQGGFLIDCRFLSSLHPLLEVRL